jgi:hypothetical protein
MHHVEPNVRRLPASSKIGRRARCWCAAACLALSSSALSCAAAVPQAEAPPSVAREVIEAQSVVARVVHYIDSRRWSELRSLFTDQVETDYRSLFGGEIQRQSADQLVLDGWRTVLTPLDTTQHLLGPIDVQITGAEARAECHVRGYHRALAAASGSEWMVAGHYVFTLVKQGDTWKIRGLTLQTTYQTGNRDLLREAAVKP